MKSEDDSMLPLVCIIGLDLLLCLITRAAIIGKSGNDVSPSPEMAPKLNPKCNPECDILLLLLGNEEVGEESSGGDTPQSKDEAKPDHPSQVEEFDLEFSNQLGPILVKVAQKLLQYAHLYVSCSSNPDVPPYTPVSLDAPREALDVLLSLSGKNLVVPKDKVTFTAHLPESVHERLKHWESALVIDPLQKKKLSIYDNVQVATCIVNFLDSHFSAFGGTRTFDPSRSLKSAITSVLMIIEYMSNLFQFVREDTAGNKLLWSLTTGIVPLSCDMMMEFAHPEFMKFITNPKEFSYSCTRYKISRCLKVLRLPEMRECELLGSILADLFKLLNSLLNDISEEDYLFDSVFSEEGTSKEII